MKQNLLSTCCMALLAYILHYANLQAADLTDRLPAAFLRVNQTNELSEGCYFAVAALSTSEQLVILTSKHLKTEKMRGENLQSPLSESITLSDMQQVWTLKRLSDNQVQLCTADGKAWLTRSSESSLGLTLKPSESDLSTWNLSQTNDGTFTLAAPENTKRAIGMNEPYSETLPPFVFDNYIDCLTKKLLLFKLPERLSDTAGKAVLPESGDFLALTALKYVRSNDGSAQTLEDALLCNGTLARTLDMEIWTAQRLDDRTFTLHNEQGKYLDYNLQAASNSATWQVVNGHFCTIETEPRFLCYDTDKGAWKVADAFSAQTDASFTLVNPTHELQTDERGVCRLSGGWTATDLANTDFEAIRCLDLTQISLPLYSKPFAHSHPQSNIPLFINAEQKEFAPAAWRWVVACGTDNRLVRSTVLADRAPFYTDRNICVDAGQISYTRTFTDNEHWQTVCLPFEAEAPRNSSVCRLRTADNEELHFEPSQNIEAGRAYIVKLSEAGTWTLQNKACTIVPQPINTEMLTGSYTGYTIESTSKSVYLLMPNANEFRRAATTSSIAPFRAYLQIESAHNTRWRF